MDKQGGFWEGSAAQLLHEIAPKDHEERGTPKTAKWLSTELVRIAPVMRNVGVDIVKKEKREGGTGRRLFVIRRIKSKSGEQVVSNGVVCEEHDWIDNPRANFDAVSFVAGAHAYSQLCSRKHTKYYQGVMYFCEFCECNFLLF